MSSAPPELSEHVLCVDVGSTFTKAALVDARSGALCGTSSHPTTAATDVLHGVGAVASDLGVAYDDPTAAVLLCSSAGGGLRLGVVGFERTVTSEAAHRVGLSAGARVEHVASGVLDDRAVAALASSRPDLLLLVGGTDGGNADVLLANAAQLARGRAALRGVPVVVAGNVDASARARAVLAEADVPTVVTDNVLPAIGVINAEPARAAIRSVFLDHVIGGKGLSAGPTFTRLVRAPTPDAVLRGVQVLAEAHQTDVLVVDVGGATTDVYSALIPEGEDAVIARDVVATLWQARTVEGDLGMRWGAPGVIEAARREHLDVSEQVHSWALRVHATPAYLPLTPEETDLDLALARLAALVAVRRHGRPRLPGETPRPLANVALLLGSGGVLRHNDRSQTHGLLHAVSTDHAGGWRVPASARLGVDERYCLFAVGLLAEAGYDEAAGALAASAIEGVGGL